ncbi:MAG: ADP-ribosylglycohydrolase family protein [Verrucomicrobiota bacterium]
MDTLQKKQASLIGAFVGDAASLGFHWLYDAERILSLAPETPEFRQPSEKDFADTKGYFAHGEKDAGDLTHYGAHLMSALKSIHENEGQWKVFSYQAQFRKDFERGGSFTGYIDGATRGTLDYLAAHDENPGLESGADDNQISGFAKVPAVVAVLAGHESMATTVDEAIRVTNHNDEAVTYNLFAARVLEKVILGQSIHDALYQSHDESPDFFDLKEEIGKALAFQGTDPVALGETFGTPCPVKNTIPLSVAILKHELSYVDAIRLNIHAGGDSAGRALFIGSVLAAAYGIGGEKGVPYHWLSEVFALDEISQYLRSL